MITLENLTEAREKILMHIARNGPKTKYKIRLETGRRYAGIHDDVEVLAKKGLLNGEKIGETQVGLAKKAYSLTLYGFCLAIKNADSSDYEKIVANWKALAPLILGKFDYFKTEMGKDETLRLIAQSSAALDFCTHYDKFGIEYERPEYELPADTFEDATVSALFAQLEGFFVESHIGLEVYPMLIQKQKEMDDFCSSGLIRDWEKLLAMDKEKLVKITSLLKRWKSCLRNCDPKLANIVDDYTQESRRKLTALQDFQGLIEEA